MLKREEAITKLNKIITTLELYNADYLSWEEEIKQLKEVLNFLES